MLDHHTAPGSLRTASDPRLPAAITRTASKQTYYTIRLLADRGRVDDAYRAYAYFRWVDDSLDQPSSEPFDRLAFLERQQDLAERAYHGAALPDLTAEEAMLVALIEGDSEPHSGLRSYIYNMMEVMCFDARRRGRLISGHELDEYTRHLATGVTDALHHFIGHDQSPPPVPERYLAVTGAHITHLLRDTIEDVHAGYFNIPCEYLDAHRIEPCDVAASPYRSWIKGRVALAHAYFRQGAAYMAQLRNIRCRLAGYAYIARFEVVLRAIERDDYQLRPAYPERKSFRAALAMLGSVVGRSLERGNL